MPPCPCPCPTQLTKFPSPPSFLPLWLSLQDPASSARTHNGIAPYDDVAEHGWIVPYKKAATNPRHSNFESGSDLEFVLYMRLKIKNYYLKICVKINMGKKVCKNTCNII